MTTSVESRHSCIEDEEGVDEEIDTEAVLDALDGCRHSDKSGSTDDLDSLPPSISLAELKNAAMQAIHRLVPVCQADMSLRERDMGIVHLLTTIHSYSSDHCLGQPTDPQSKLVAGKSRPPVAEVAALVRLSFYPEHRAAICDLGGVHALIELLRVEYSIAARPELLSASKTANVRSSADDSSIDMSETSLTLRRYICMALTNLTYGVAANKALLCRRLATLEALLAQLESDSEELKQVSASVLRNLCWKTDSRSKLALRRVDAPRRLTLAAMTARKDSTLRTTLSALWNLSSHCSHNKRAICSVDGVFSFLLKTMNCEDLVGRLVLVENSGGIFRNLSAVVAAREDLRLILHQNDCYPILINLLRNAPSLTVVVNVCGALWNLTAPPRCPSADLTQLSRSDVLELLHQLSCSPHELICNSSTAVLRNLLHPAHFQQQVQVHSGSKQHIHNQSDYGDTKEPHLQHEVSSVSSPSSASSVEEQDNGSPGSRSDRSCRRLLGSRAQLRFGLLSVVLEADDADEEAAEESDGDEGDSDDDDDTCDLADRGSDGSFYANQEALVTDESSDTLLTHSIHQSFNPEETSKCKPVDSWNSVEPDEEQTCVYAEEGTPFSPDSANGSYQDLHHLQRNITHVSADQVDQITSYISSNALPLVCDLGNTPSETVSNLRESFQQFSHIAPLDHHDDDVAQLPSPPPDLSRLVSPLLHVKVDDCEPNTNVGFQLPPPPPSHFPMDIICTVQQAPLSPVQSPSLLSRSSPSDPSSVDFQAVSETSPRELLYAMQHKNISGKVNVIVNKEVIDSSSVAELEESVPPLRFSHEDALDEANEGDEIRLAFAEEGTPKDTVSLHDGSRSIFRSTGHGFIIPTLPDYTCWHHSNNDPSEAKFVPDDCDDDDEQRNSHILQECIASAMPTSSSFSHCPEISADINFQATVAGLPIFAQEDSIQSFAVEDTPFSTSTKTSSLSDISILDPKSLVPIVTASDQPAYICHNTATSMPPCYNVQGARDDRSSASLDHLSSSGSSSANGDTSSDLLSEVIQSAMPKSLRPDMTCGEPSDVDCLQLYAVEGTPGEEDLSDSSSSHPTANENLQSLTSHCSVADTTQISVIPTTASSGPPAPPRRTSSTLSNHKDPFALVNPAVIRPQATVAPMPQVNRFSPTSAVSRDLSVHSESGSGTAGCTEFLKQPSSRETPSVQLTDKDDASSFSSLLSIESAGLEHNLLQECISSAMPRPKLIGCLRKPSIGWHPSNSDAETNGEVPRDHVEREEDLAIGSSGIPRLEGRLVGSQLSSVRSSAFHSRASSPGLRSAPANLLQPNRIIGSKKIPHQNGPLHFLAYGSGDAFRGSNTATIPKPMVTPQLNLYSVGRGFCAKRVDRASSEVKTKIPNGTNSTQRRDQSNSTNTSTVTSLPVHGGCSPCPADTRSSATPNDSLFPKNRPDSATSSVAQVILAEGAQAVLAALHGDSVDSGSKLESPNLSLPSKASNKFPPTTKHSNSTSSPRGSSVPPSVTGGAMAITKLPVSPQAPAVSRIVPPSVNPKQIRPPNTSIMPPVSLPSKQPSCVLASTSTSCSTGHSGLRQPSLLPTRSIFTCPPSAANGRSLTSSRSASASGSQTNLHKRVGPKSTAQTVSAQSICAALVKQERQSSAVKKPVASNQPKTIGATRVVTQNKVGTNNVLSSSTGQLAKNQTNRFGSRVNSQIENEPKPIRGGRKSLTGRKTLTTATNRPTEVLSKPVVRPVKNVHRSPESHHLKSVSGSRECSSRSHLISEHAADHQPSDGRSSIPCRPSKNPPVSVDEEVEENSDKSEMWIVRGELSRLEQVNCI